MAPHDDPFDRLAAADPLREKEQTGDDRQAAEALLARVLATPTDVGISRRGRWAPRLDASRVAAAALAAIVVLCAVVLADPFGGDERGGVVEEALAAVGDGPVLHVRTALDTGATRVDLDDGERRPLTGTIDTWYDPRRGLRFVYRVGGVVLEDMGTPIGKRLLPGTVPGTIQLFTRDYRDALSSGRARVLEEGEVDGVPVYWIRVPLSPRPGQSASCEDRRAFCRDVAVSRETYEPLYLDSYLGARGRRDLERIVEIESMAEGGVAIPGPGAGPAVGFTTLPRRSTDRAGAARSLGKAPIWPGGSIAGLRLAGVSVAGMREYVFTRAMRKPRYGPRQRVVRLVYGSPREIASGRPVRTWKTALVIQQADESAARAVGHGPSLRYHEALYREGSTVSGAPSGYLSPAGEVVVAARGHDAALRRDGLAIGVYGSSPALTRAAVAALTR
ncbi:MAG TPA: hypothetical protein VFQ14_03435 [Thermoleophilaceae bacterium]|nr:hypothetical protein [Thermoleophilaceae bacterium]